MRDVLRAGSRFTCDSHARNRLWRGRGFSCLQLIQDVVFDARIL
jgi:hypothetical protein